MGVMLVGLGGNNGSTCVAAAVANRLGLTWETKQGTQSANYWGSLLLASTVKLGHAAATGEAVYTPLQSLLPLGHPNEIVWGGWDINGANLAEAMKRAQVLEVDLQRQLEPYLREIVPLPSIYHADFIAANQQERANNVLPPDMTKWEKVQHIRRDIAQFKAQHDLDHVTVVWTANTERFCEIQPGVHDTADHLLHALEQGNDTEVSPSTLFAIASILEQAPFVNGSPQNTLVPGVVQLAERHGVLIGGDDFKSGQTKLKSVLVDFLVSAGCKPVSMVSYNHLGNNDGRNLSAPHQFRSKEISKSNVVDDMVASNAILYPHVNKRENKDTTTTSGHPDHVVVIKYVPYVGDSKRAMDEYTSEIFMGGTNTLVIHNTCQDSLLATPLIYDLILLTELCSRIQVQTVDEQDDSTLDSVVNQDDKDDKNTTAWEPFHPVLSLLSYMLKAPMVPPGAPVVNALFPQREAITNVLKACLGLPPENYMTLQHKFASSLQQQHDETMRRRQQTQVEEQEKQTSTNGVSHTTTNGVMPTSNGHATRNGTGQYQNGTH